MTKQHIYYEFFACPTCLENKFYIFNDKDEEFIICSSCNGVYPIIFCNPFLLDIRSLLAIPDEYLGAWHVSQLNSLSMYQNSDIQSISSVDRADVKQVISLLNLKNKIVLDIGSGVFSEPQYVTKLGAKKIICLDPIPAEYKVNFSLIGGIAEFLPFKSNSFDAITIITSLDHLIDLDNAIREFNRILKPNGKVYCWGELTDDPKLLGKKNYYQILPRTKVIKTNINDLEQSIKEYRKNKNIYQKKLEYIEENKGLYLPFLVDNYHIRHFSEDDLLDGFGKGGFQHYISKPIWYPSGTFTHYMEFKKINNDNKYFSNIIKKKNKKNHNNILAYSWNKIINKVKTKVLKKTV